MCIFIKKETLPLVFSCHVCEIFKDTFFIEHLRWLLLPILKPLNSQKQLLCKGISELGGDYMIPFCRDEILSRFAGIPAV